ncbi:MAG: peptidylprolyl isomerase [Lachnospiraceae bacterium]|nr:peptidylprolyl isomerase [Lachnospiraceae bacterium]
MKKIGRLLIFLLTTLILAGCSGDGNQTKVVLTTGFERDEVFRIDQESCSRAELMVYLANLKNEYEKIYGSEIWEKEVVSQTLKEGVKETALARIAQIKAMKLLAADQAITLDTQEIKKAQQAAETYFSTLTESERQILGVSEALLVTMYQEYALADKLYDHIIKDVNPEISDDEARNITIEQIFLRCYSLNGKGEKILYTDEEWQEVYRKAQEVRQLALDGEDFTQLSEQYSDHQSGQYSFGKGEVEEALEVVSFNLGNLEISEVIKGEEGYYIIKCISTFNREETQENKSKIIEQRKKEVFDQVYHDFLITLTKNMNTELIESIDLPENATLDTSEFFVIYQDIFQSEQ